MDAAVRHRLLWLYPRAWRRRYGREMDLLLDDRPPGVRDRLDMVTGALDAHLHPSEPQRWPVLAAAAGGIAWTSLSAFAAGQPSPPDWPGYLVETLPLVAVAVPVLALAALGASMRLGDRDPRGLGTARSIALGGSLAWTALLVRALAEGWSGPELGIAASVTALGFVLIGLVLQRAGDWPVSGLLVAAGGCLLVPWVWAGVLYGAAWVASATIQLRDPRPVPPTMAWPS